MMLDPTTTQYVPSLPSPNPAPIDVHLDDDMSTNKTNTISDTTMDTSGTATSPASTSAQPTSAKMQTNVETAESVTEFTQPPIPMPAETQPASVEVKVDIDGGESAMEASTNTKSVEETTSTSPTPPERPASSHTTPTPAQDTTLKDVAEEDSDGDTVAGATITPPSTQMSAETELEGPKPDVAEVKEAGATKTESSIENPAGHEPELSNTETTDPMDLDVVENSGGEVKNAFSHDHDPNTPAEEVTHAQGGSDHPQITSKDVSPAEVVASNPDSTTGVSQSDDTTAQVSKLYATYDSSGESRASEREEEKMEDDTVPGTQNEHTSSDGGKVMVSEPAVDNNSTATTLESIADKGEEEKIPPAETRGSLFGGPAGKQVSPIAEPPEAPRVDPVAETETSKGFGELFQDGMTDISEELSHHIQLSQSLDTGDFKFQTNDAEGNAEPDVEQDSQPEAVLGAEREDASPPLSSDHDTKPDMNAHSSNSSPAYPHATSSTNSQPSHQTNTTQDEDMDELYSSAEIYSQGADPKEFSADYFNIEETPSGTDQPVLETVEQEQLCNCEIEYPCSHCIIREHNLRPGPRKDGYVPFGTQIPDTDKSGDYTDDRKYYLSTQQVTQEDRDEDEDTINDEEAQDYAMSLGLISDNTDLMGGFSKTIPYNKTDPLIRDKRVFDEESSSEDESEAKKSKKRKNKGKSTRKAKRPKITDDNDEFANRKPHPLSRPSRSTGKMPSRIRDSDDESDTRPTHRKKERSTVLPHLSTTLGTLAESLRNRQSSSLASKPTKSTPSKKKAKKTTTTSPSSASSEPTLTITQMVSRLAKPLVTKLCYPISFNSPSDSCSFCTSPSYALIGTGSPRNIKIYDFGQGNREVVDAVQAGKFKAQREKKPEETRCCLVCTTKYLRLLMCKGHDVVPLDFFPNFSPSEAVARATSHQCTKAEVNTWCSLCPAPATYSCDKKCGAKFCDTCGSKLYGEHEGNLTAMLENTKDEVTREYEHGLRADVELLRKGGELEKFLARMASSAGRNRG
ncbi:hypothetical protein KCU65_g6164, partial [Aureobasidium melanogenum]